MLIVQHMPAGFTHTLAQSLNSISPLTVHEATNGDRLARGLALMAAGGLHLRVQNRQVYLDESPPRNHVRPSVDVTIETAVNFFGANIIGVILTGMGQDGKAGAKLIKDAGGHVIVESESTSIVYGMPGSVVRAGLADQILPLPQIASSILEQTGNG
jgi:two-component system chemotaxis response regulator CheB